jgi:chromosome condensin MukBEF MukE localization factor
VCEAACFFVAFGMEFTNRLARFGTHHTEEQFRGKEAFGFLRKRNPWQI